MLRNLLLVAIVGCIASACSNEIDLVDTKKEIPVIYGFLSRKDTAHYIRIERAFGDDKISPGILAKNIDSLYYKDITVQLIRKKDNSVFTLTRVDGNNEGYVRDTGVFLNKPNYLYKINANKINLFPNETYKLVVKRNDGTALAEAETIVIPDMLLLEARTLAGLPPRLSVQGGFRLFWNTPGNSSEILNAKIYDVKMIIEVTERFANEDKKVTLTWNIANGYVPNPKTNSQLEPGTNTVQYWEKDGQAFYRFLAQNLDANTKPTRVLSSIKVRVDAAGQELFNYIDIANINLGITGTEVQPTYTNIKNGYGILSSRNYFISNKITLSGNSIDSLKNGRFTKNFGFVN
ncbi:MAG: DUF4249 family protein [Saprospiraceae bacterium]